MRRVLGVLLGGAFGLLITWAGLYVFSKLNLGASGNTGGCGDIEHCGPEWAGAAMVAALLVPAVVGAGTGFAAAHGRWGARKTGIWFAGLSVLTFACLLLLHVK